MVSATITNGDPNAHDEKRGDLLCSSPIPIPSPPLSYDQKPAPKPTQEISDLNGWNSDELPKHRRPRNNWQEDANDFSRWVDDNKVIGNFSQSAIAREDYDKDHEDVDSTTVSYELQVESTIGSASGLILGTIVHWIMRGKYPRRRRSDNPFYRTFKVLANIGAALGMSIGYMLPLPKNMQKMAGNVFADIISIGLAILALPYWLIKAYVLETPPEKKNINAKIGNESWSKYAKTLLVFGIALGQIIGAVHSWATGVSLYVDIGIASGVTGVAVCLLGLVLVPVINSLTNGKLKTDKDTFRNNYVRSGMLLGASIGSAIGFILGTFLFPGIGSSIGMTIGGAIGSIIGGTYYGIQGKKITKKIHGDNDCENSWDYGSRSVLYIGAAIGTVIGLFIPAPGASILINAAFSAAIGGILGWYAGYKAVEHTAKKRPKEQYAHSMPWTQRMATGSNIFSIIGAGVGLGLGLVFGGPFGAVVGASAGYAIGSIVGSVVSLFYDPVPKIDEKQKLDKDGHPDPNRLIPYYDTKEKVTELATGCTHQNIPKQPKIYSDNKLPAVGAPALPLPITPPEVKQQNPITTRLESKSVDCEINNRFTAQSKERLKESEERFNSQNVFSEHDAFAGSTIPTSAAIPNPPKATRYRSSNTLFSSVDPEPSAYLNNTNACLNNKCTSLPILIPTKPKKNPHTADIKIGAYKSNFTGRASLSR